MRTLFRKLHNFLRWSWLDRWLFFQAYLGLGLARLALLTLPFRWVGKHLGTPQAETPVKGLTESERVVVISTAHGLKFSRFKVDYHKQELEKIVERFANPPFELPADFDIVRNAIEESKF